MENVPACAFFLRHKNRGTSLPLSLSNSSSSTEAIMGGGPPEEEEHNVVPVTPAVVVMENPFEQPVYNDLYEESGDNDVAADSTTERPVVKSMVSGGVFGLLLGSVFGYGAMVGGYVYFFSTCAYIH